MSPGREISNPFISLLQDNLSSDVSVRTFDWKSAFLSRYDVLHVHWPDSLLIAPSRLKRARKIAILVALIARNRLLGVRHIWTVHNLSPHEHGGKFNALALAAWAMSCKTRVYLSAAAMPLGGDPRGIVIKHGDYSSVVGPGARQSHFVPGRLLIFGLLRQYKGIESLVDAVGSLSGDDVSLRIAGRPVPAEYGRAIGSLIAETAHIEVRLERLTDAELISEIAEAEIVVLPYTRIYNSGAALMALSAGRPIITTDSPTMRELQAEVGPEWLQILDGGTNAESVRRTVDALRNLKRGSIAPFIDRHWSDIGDAYSHLYRYRSDD